MKKIISIIITLCILLTTTYAYNLTKIINGKQQITTMNEGENITLIYNDKVGYSFAGWSATGITLANPTSKTINITMPANDVTITASTSTVSGYTLTVVINGVTEVSQKVPGESVTLTAVPASGYTFSGWTASGITLANTATVTFTMPENNVTVEANFVESHTHSYSEATCIIAPTCSCGATNGNALGHSYSEATCTEVATCSRCGETSGEALGHDFTGGTRTCNVNGSTDEVKCSRCDETESQICTHEYTITATQKSNGIITLNVTTVKAGGSATATIVANSGYDIKSVIVNETNQGTITSYSFSNITSNQTITAEYIKQAIITNSNVAIGAYISYNPSSTSYTVSTGDSGYTSSQNFNPSSTTSWRVMYNNEGQLDIVSADSVGNVSLKGVTGYAKAVDTLNNIGNAYVNSTYATKGRHIGSASSSIGTITTPITWEYTYNQGNTGSPYSETLYITDLNQLKKNSLLHSSGNVWLASRGLGANSEYSHGIVRIMNKSGGIVNTNGPCLVYPDGSVEENVGTRGVRPVVSLRSEIRITGGSGTSTDPYQISI